MTMLLDRADPCTPLATRLLPLHIAAFLQGFMLWPPVEKLFMTEIGFDAVDVGVMAALYAALVPMIEIPSGILADRWSRQGVLVVASLALTLCALIGGLSDSVTTYMFSALFLGVYFAMHSGTMESIVYDTVLEETGGSEVFERRIGRLRLLESTALVTGSLLGGWIAGVTSTRLTYFLTVPFAALSIAAYLRFREPTLHRTGDTIPLRRHLAVTVQALTRRGRLLPIITLAVLSSLILQLLIEFGPLWLVTLAVPAALYGPYWAGLMSSLGLGGLVAGRIQLEQPATGLIVAGLMVLASATLTASTSTSTFVVTIAQVLLGLLVTVAGIHVARLMHDAVPSAIRSGVASGVGAISWMVFLPVALVLGAVSARHGVHTAGWILTAISVIAGALLVTHALRRPKTGVAPRASSGQ
jgi:MFS family permease